MPKATLISADGRSDDSDVPVGVSLMQAATQAGISGIVGDCGGAMSCATCHIQVDQEFLSLLPPIFETEDAMLDFTAAPREANSRLSCQVLMTQAIDGIVARIADPQT